MASPDIPNWHANIPPVPKWGTTESLTLNQLVPTILDVNGRPLMEDSSINPADAPFELTIIQFNDSRKGKMGNRSAYLEVLDNLAPTLDVLSYIRNTLHPYKKFPKFRGLKDVVYTSQVLPNWLVLKADDPMRSGEVPMDIANVAKVARGLVSPFERTWKHEIYARDEGRKDKPDTSFIKGPDEFFQFVNTNNGLLSTRFEGQACPASRRVIDKCVGVLLTAPTEGMEEVPDRLGITEADIFRMRDFATAQSTSSTESIYYSFPVTENERSDIIRDRAPAGLVNARRRRRQQFALMMNNNGRKANDALGRNRLPEFTEWDFREAPLRVVSRIKR